VSDIPASMFGLPTIRDESVAKRAMPKVGLSFLRAAVGAFMLGCVAEKYVADMLRSQAKEPQ
jgi:hypothetical protein